MHPSTMIELYDQVQKLYEELDMVQKPKMTDKVKVNRIYLRKTLLIDTKRQTNGSINPKSNLLLARSYGSLTKVDSPATKTDPSVTNALSYITSKPKMFISRPRISVHRGIKPFRATNKSLQTILLK